MLPRSTEIQPCVAPIRPSPPPLSSFSKSEAEAKTAKGGQKQLAALAKAWQAGSPGKAKGGQKQLAALAKAWQVAHRQSQGWAKAIGCPSQRLKSWLTGQSHGWAKAIGCPSQAWQAGSPGKARGGQSNWSP
ncbi:hypothetical protein RHMOL_RhmolUnG0006800 [Rhododendron molle]|nr:hypothetical protein RHMOL_RhmolUnG0006800 [Rhododendron molle]